MYHRPSIWDGLDQTRLQQMLGQAQQALADLTSGTKTEVASYAQGDGTRMVKYTTTNVASLIGLITSLQTQLGISNGDLTNRRAPIRPYF